MSKKLDIEYIRKEFLNKKGWKLMSTEYINSKTKLDFVCDKGHKHSMIWNSFQQGRDCIYCLNRAKPTIDFIKQEFFNVDFELLSTEYVNNYTKLDYRCKKCNTIHKTMWHDFHGSKVCPLCAIKKRPITNSKGITKLKLPLYKTFAPQLEKYEQIHLIQQNGLDLLGVNCLYCNKVFIPTRTMVTNRIKAIKNSQGGEGRFYCSDSCKQACPTYRKRKYSEGYTPATSREMQPQFRKMVLGRDNWACQKCGINKEDNLEVELHAHHIDPVSQNPIESCDVDNGVTLCKKCHQEVHQIDGCSLMQLKCENKN